jgi:hypothetical protein
LGWDSGKKTSGIGPQALTNSECCLGIKAVLDGKDPNALDNLQNITFGKQGLV